MDIGIIGAGASGIMAGLIASQWANVTILEKNEYIGRKLIATGNGQCNFTNMNINVNRYHGENINFFYSPFYNFNQYSTIEFFKNIGIYPEVDLQDRVYPISRQSKNLVDILELELEKRKVNILLNTEVKNIKKSDKFIVSSHEKTSKFDKLIIATGGYALPTSGSNGDGYRFAEKFGHNIIKIKKALVPLYTDDNYLKEKSGVRVDAKASLLVDDKFIDSYTGDILFTDYGLSGPTILQLSRRALDGLDENKNVKISVDLLKGINNEELRSFLKTNFKENSSRKLEDLLLGLINKKLIIPLLLDSALDKNKRGAEISNREIESLAKILKDWRFNITGSRDWEFAQVTAGGIDTSEINNETMESKLVKDLYFIGEVLDIDGDSGGFNLQWAFSTAYTAAIDLRRD